MPKDRVHSHSNHIILLEGGYGVAVFACTVQALVLFSKHGFDRPLHHPPVCVLGVFNSDLNKFGCIFHINDFIIKVNYRIEEGVYPFLFLNLRRSLAELPWNEDAKPSTGGTVTLCWLVLQSLEALQFFFHVEPSRSSFWFFIESSSTATNAKMIESCVITSIFRLKSKCIRVDLLRCV